MKKNYFLLLIALFISSLTISQNNTIESFVKGLVSSDEPFELPKTNPSTKEVTFFSEGFEDITTLESVGWVFKNNSNPVGGISWFQGNPGVFNAYDGATNAYLAVNFQSTGAIAPNTISNWALTPEFEFSNGYVVSFFVRKVLGSTWPDRLQVRLSTNGNSIDVGETENSVGDFSILLEDINPTYIQGGFPVSWERYVIRISGISGIQSGRLAFRYYVEDGGPVGTNSDYIGIDRVEIEDYNPIPLSNWSFILIGVLLTFILFFKFKK